MYHVRKVKSNEKELVLKFIDDLENINEENFNITKESTAFYGAFEGEKIISIIGLDNDRKHIVFMFTKEEYRFQNNISKIFNFMLDDIIIEKPNLKYITTNAIPTMTDFYHKLGFIDLDIELEKDDFKYVPMIYLISNNLKLIYPNETYREQIEDYKQEFIENDDSMDGTGSLRIDEVDKWIKDSYLFLNPNTIPNPKWVPAAIYLIIRKDDNRLVGIFNLRYILNDFLLNIGGHIGYSIRKSERRKGYAKEALRMCLSICKNKNINNVLITCLKSNEASRRTILSCGGVYDNEVYFDEDKEYIERYWFKLN